MYGRKTERFFLLLLLLLLLLVLLLLLLIFLFLLLLVLLFLHFLLFLLYLHFLFLLPLVPIRLISFPSLRLLLHFNRLRSGSTQGTRSQSPRYYSVVNQRPPNLYSHWLALSTHPPLSPYIHPSSLFPPPASTGGGLWLSKMEHIGKRCQDEFQGVYMDRWRDREVYGRTDTRMEIYNRQTDRHAEGRQTNGLME